MITTITTITTATTTTLIAAPHLTAAGIVAVATLIILLAIREIFGADTSGNPVLKSVTQISGIVSVALLFAFASIVATKVLTIL
ncbi:MAG: hypothetical protein WAX07_08710 [Candidatus Altiarchaeia archaeon]